MCMGWESSGMSAGNPCMQVEVFFFSAGFSYVWDRLVVAKFSRDGKNLAVSRLKCILINKIGNTRATSVKRRNFYYHARS